MDPRANQIGEFQNNLRTITSVAPNACQNTTADSQKLPHFLEKTAPSHPVQASPIKKISDLGTPRRPPELSSRPTVVQASSTPSGPFRTLSDLKHTGGILLGRKDHDGEKSVKIHTTVRLPLRHEMGERAGVRWCSGLRGNHHWMFGVRRSAFDVQNDNLPDRFHLPKTRHTKFSGEIRSKPYRTREV